MKEKACISILVLTITILAVSGISCLRVEAQTGSASINNYFPTDFPTAQVFLNPTSYPYSSNTVSYVLEGQAAPLYVHLNYYAGAGNLNQAVTIEASCAAFVSTVNQTLAVTQNQVFTFTLTPTIKSGIDGTYNINFIANDEMSDQIGQTSTSINVWSTPHVEASNLLYTAASLTYSYPYGLSIIYDKYQSPQAKANQTLATIEFASAMTSFNNKDWNGTETHAQNSINLVKAADASETASDLQGGTTYLVRLITYPIVILAVLMLVYMIVVIYRKIYPSTNKPNES